MDLISFIIILLILYLLYKILYCGKKENIEGFSDDIKDRRDSIQEIEKNIIANLDSDIKLKDNGLVTIPTISRDDYKDEEGVEDEEAYKGAKEERKELVSMYLREKSPESTTCEKLYESRLSEMISAKLGYDNLDDAIRDYDQDTDSDFYDQKFIDFIEHKEKINLNSIKKGIPKYLRYKNSDGVSNYEEFFEETSNLLDYFSCMRSDSETKGPGTKDKATKDRATNEQASITDEVRRVFNKADTEKSGDLDAVEVKELVKRYQKVAAGAPGPMRDKYQVTIDKLVRRANMAPVNIDEFLGWHVEMLAIHREHQRSKKGKKDLKRSIDIKVEKLNIPSTKVGKEFEKKHKKLTPKIEEFCKRYKDDSNESLNLLDFKPIPLEANTLEKQNDFLEKEVSRHKKLDQKAKRKIYDDCKGIVRNHVNNIIELKAQCHKSGERCFDTIKNEKIKQSTNVNLTDNKNFSEYLNNCNKDVNRCGYLDDDQPPLNYLERKNEYMNTLNNYNSALLNFKSIKDNENLRLELYKKAYGNKQWNEGYNSPPPPPPEKKVNEYQKDTPQWIINDISDLEENKIVNTKLVENERINVDQTTESITNLTLQNKILDEKIKKYDNLIRDNKSEKISLNKLPLTCEECVPCRTCNKCITLSKYEDLNKCPKCPGCNQEVNTSISTQKNICDTRILQVQNELDGVVTKKQNDLKNDERWTELNSKLAELSRKKALQSSSMRSCENEKLIKDTGIQESIRNIKRMKLKNDELQDRIDHERDISWFDRLKGVSKPFKSKKKYSMDIEEPKEDTE